MLTIPAPRLLPMTIATLTALLVVKSGGLLETALTAGHKPGSGIVTIAKAAGPDTEAGHVRPPTPSAPPAAPPPVGESEKALLLELRQRRKELDAIAESIAARESLLVAAERKIAARVTELQSLQKELEGLDAARKQKEDTGWQGLVKLYEAMKPKDAATIFNDLSMPVLLQVLDRMKDTKAAAIMSAMAPERARDVTAELARTRTGRDPSTGPEPGLAADKSPGG